MNANINVTDPTPTTSGTVFDATGQAFTASQLITMSCQAVANTVFTPLTPKPDWYDALNDELGVAQNLANQWLGDMLTQVTSAIPAQVIDFGPNFTAATGAIMQIVNANPTASGADNPYVVEVKEIIEQTLLPPLQTVLSNIDKMSATLQTWGGQIQTAHNNLVSGAANIQSAEIALQGDISKMNNAIKALHDEIDAENKAIAASAAAIGIGLFALVVGIALAPETGGASLVIGGFIGAAGIIGGGVTWGIMQAKINEQFDEIAKDQKELADDQRQIVALQGLSMASNQVVTNLEAISNALSILRTQWGLFGDEIQGVLTKLNAADQALSTIVEGVFTQAAQTEWNSAMETANALANRKIDLPSKVLPMDAPTTQAA